MRSLIWLLPIFILLVFSSLSLSMMRGIEVTDKEGNVLDLYSDYSALVVGIGDYKAGWPELPGAVEDAQDVARSLQEYGFKVKLIINPDSKRLKRALNEFVFNTGKKKDRAMLFYFAGHGDTLKLADGTELGYIIPADCPLKMKNPIDFDDMAISMKEMEGLSLKVRAKHFLMVFDSCFSGSLFNLVRAAPVEITEKALKPVRQFITAGSAGEQVPDKSVFKQVFLEGIRGEADLNGDNFVTASELGMHLQTRVVNYTRGGQHPQYGKINNPLLDKGDFVFVSLNKMAETRAKEQEKKARQEALGMELERLQKQMKANEALMAQMKQLLEMKLEAEENTKTTMAEREALLKEEQKEWTQERRKMDEKIRELEARLRTAEENRKIKEVKKKKRDAEMEDITQELARLREERKQNEALQAKTIQIQEERQKAWEERLREEKEKRKKFEAQLKRLAEERRKANEKQKQLEEKQIKAAPQETKNPEEGDKSVEEYRRKVAELKKDIGREGSGQSGDSGDKPAEPGAREGTQQKTDKRLAALGNEKKKPKTLLKDEDEYRIEVKNGAATIRLQNPARAEKKVAFEYLDSIYERRFDGQGRALLRVCLQDRMNEIAFTRTNGVRETISDVCDAEYRNLMKLIIRWQDPVDVDLVLGKPDRAGKDAFHNRMFVSDDRMKRYQKDFFALSDNATGKKGSFFEESFITDSIDLFDELQFYVRYTERGTNPRPPYCEGGAKSEVSVDVISVYMGAKEKRTIKIQPLDCGKQHDSSRLYIHLNPLIN